ncbi:MAG TPA: flagellar hook-associated protein FlgK [Burkholderiales bacterium]|nr:flagellar hook-associated protein FlgK [Burkholderiales bacterium]
MSDIFSIGLTALNAAQAGILVTGNNIANANTPGYNRQQIVQTTNIPQGTGAGFFGQGTQVATVKRLYSEFLTNQTNQAQTMSSQLSTYSTQVNQIDNLLGSNGLGLNTAIQGFFSAVQGVANDPSSISSRQAMLSASQTMTSTFQNASQQLASIRTGVNGQITSSVGQINSYAQQIGQLNQAIIQAQGASNGQPPNDLMDQRDQLIAQMSQEIQTTVVKQSDGSYNVLIGNGQSLVVGSQVSQLVASPNPADPSNMSVGFSTASGTNYLPDSSIQGGNLGGLFSFRSQTLDPAQNALGRIAIGIAQTFNSQQQLGQDLNGNLGQAYFNAPAPAVIPNPANGTGSSADVSFASANATTSLNIAASLNGAAAVPATTPFNPSDPSSYNFTNTSTIYDSLGQAHTAATYYANAGPNTWNVYTTIDGISVNPSQTSGTQLQQALANASAAAAQVEGASATQISSIQTTVAAAAASGTVSPSAIQTAAVNAATTAGLSAASAAAIGSIEYAIANAAGQPGATSSSLSAAASGAALSNGISPANAQTIGASVSVVPNAGSADPSVLLFDSGGNLITGSPGYGVTSGSISASLPNGAAPLNITENFSGISQGASFSVSSVTQDGNPSGLSQLTGDNYLLKYNGTNWSLIDTTTNQAVPMTGSGTAASPFSASGMNIVVAAPTSGTASFIVKPTANGAQDISVVMTDPSLIAAASPIKTSPALNPDGSFKNTGTGTISSGMATPPLNANLQDNVTITFNNPPTTFNVLDTTTNTTLASNVSYSSGNPISYNGWTASITGTPNAGDSFNISKNIGANTDNSNALKLAGLQTANTLEGGNTSFVGAYSQLVAQVGTTASQMQVTSQAQTALVTQLTQQQQSLSGVNLDEEAANLIRYQQAYQAAGKMMQVASTLFQSILQI